MKPNEFLALLLLLQAVHSRMHYIPHTHLDMGWLKSIVNYYRQDVKPILDSLADALENTPEDLPPRLTRKFSFNDLGFLRMWLQENPESISAKLKSLNALIDKGQFEVVGTGMVMPDSACPHYEDFVSNFFAGIGMTQTLFRTRSQTLWQLDSFGQTVSLYYVASLFKIFDTVFPRINHAIRGDMQNNDLFEFIWQLPKQRQINVHLLEHYGWTPGIGCDTFCKWGFLDYNMYLIFKNRAKRGFRNSAMALLGDDFTYTQAAPQFAWIEKAAVQDPSFTYSTMGEYLDDFYQKKRQMMRLSGDFLPFVDLEDTRDSWTGYFTTKPHIKYRVKWLQQLQRGITFWALSRLQREREMLSHTQGMVHTELVELAADVALTLHHDVITGTSIRVVDGDYLNRMELLEAQIIKIFSSLSIWEVTSCDWNAKMTRVADCMQLWQSLDAGKPVRLFLINPAPTIRKQRLRIAVPRDYVNRPVLFYVGETQVSATQAICFAMLEDCLLETELFVGSAREIRTVLLKGPRGDPNIRSTEWFQRLDDRTQVKPVDFETIIGDVKISVTKDSVVIQDLNYVQDTLTLELLRIRGWKSNAYVTSFGEGAEWEAHGSNDSVQFYESRLDDWGVIVTRSNGVLWIHKPVGKFHFEVELLLNPDFVGNDNREIALRISKPDLGIQPEFWVESNGLFELQRKYLDSKPDFSIYPTTTKASLRYLKAGRVMDIWTDRARGVAASGHQLYAFVQRSGLKGKGNYENLYIYESVFTKISVHCHPSDIPETDELFLRNAADLPLLTFFDTIITAPIWRGPSFIADRRPEGELLPHNIRVTVNIATAGQFIVRFQNIYRTAPTFLKPGPFLRFHFPFAQYWEVDFSTVIVQDDTDRLLVRDRVVLASLAYLTILVIPS